VAGAAVGKEEVQIYHRLQNEMQMLCPKEARITFKIRQILEFLIVQKVIQLPNENPFQS